jgi:outer membrane receptor protein involved in Fe transport
MMRPSVALCLVLGALSVGPAALAQSEIGTGAIAGEVRDSHGAAVEHAAVTVVNADTGLTRHAFTGSAGEFTVPVLPSGRYTVRLEKPGFATAAQTDVVVSVGASVSVLATLQVGSISETVTVESQVAIDTTKTAEASLVSREELQDLPLNGRRYDQFALLTPGVTRDATFGLLSFRGMSGVWNNFMVDGANDNQAYNAEARGRTRVATNLSFDAIQEFQVGHSNFSAEFGRAIGGNINAVVRSGGNAFHADAFYYYKDANLSARDPFASFKPDERRQQFGGSASGPILRNKLFYFVNYDRQVRDWPLVFQDTSGVLTNGNPTDPASLSPNCRSSLSSSGCLADVAAFGAGVAALRSKMPGGGPGNALPRTFDHDLALAKVEWLVNSNNTATLTYNYLNHRAENGIFTNTLVTNSLGSNGHDEVHTHTLIGRWTTTLGANKVNEVRAEWSRDDEFQFSSDPPPNVAIGSFSFGKSTGQDNLANPDERHYQLLDNFSLIAGRHNLKIGGEVEVVHEFLNRPTNFSGGYSYANALAYGRDLLRMNSAGVLDPNARNYTSFRQSFGLATNDFNVINYGTFVQDQWRMTPRLTLNLGLRYDYQQLPDPHFPNPAIPESETLHSDHTNLGPRVAAAWDPRGNGRTVLRAGYGMFFSPTPLGTIDNALRQTGLIDPNRALLALSFSPTTSGAPVYPSTFSQLPAAAGSAAAPSVTRLDPSFRRPRAQEVNVGIEQLLPGGVVLSASYVYTKGDRLPFSFDTNLPAPAFTRTYALPDGTTFSVPFTAGPLGNVNSARPNPSFGAINVIRPLGLSWYNALLVEATKRFRNNYEFHISYTLSKAEDVAGTGDGSGRGDEGPFGGFNILDQFDIAANRSRASTDQRHRFVASAVWNLPAGGKNGSFANRLARDWRVAAIFTAQSGRPFPSGTFVVTGIPFSTPDGRQWQAFGFNLYGQGGSSLLPSVPRNNNTGAANYALDMRLSREFHFRGGYVLELMGEGFNLFNHGNFNQYNSTLYNVGPTTAATLVSVPVLLTPVASFGTPFGDGAPPDGTNARRFQLSARFRF